MIAMHNYCHILDFTVRENEASFSKEHSMNFLNQIDDFSEYWIYNFFSFLGMYGVPVFIFLTGYGLVKKYENPQSRPMVKSIFMYNNWLKLLALMLPGVICYIGIDFLYYIHCGHLSYLTDICKRLFILTFLNDILGPWMVIDPGIYWYFGLTLEFYFIYAFFVYNRPVSLLILMTAGAVVLQTTAYKEGWIVNSQPALWWVRQNITGWMVPFTFGILYARTRTMPKFTTIVLITAAAILFFPSMTDPVLWQVSLVCSVIISIMAAGLSMKIPYWSGFWIFIGRLSPFIFASHPIVRHVYFTYLTTYHEPNGLLLASYIVTALGFAIIYRYVWSFLTPLLKKISDKIMALLRSDRAIIR